MDGGKGIHAMEIREVEEEEAITAHRALPFLQDILIISTIQVG
jgi:hypothetical protein